MLLSFDDLVRQLIRICRRSRKMRGQYSADFINRFDQRVAEVLILKMDAHSIHNVLPELFAAFFVNRLVADDGEFVRPGRYENKDGVALASLVHSETLKFLLGSCHRIRLEPAALNINANFARGFRFSSTNRFNYPVVIQFAEKFFRAHLLPARSGAATTKTPATSAEPAETISTAR
jgi:hypothetical protein